MGKSSNHHDGHKKQKADKTPKVDLENSLSSQALQASLEPSFSKNLSGTSDGFHTKNQAELFFVGPEEMTMCSNWVSFYVKGELSPMELLKKHSHPLEFLSKSAREGFSEEEMLFFVSEYDRKLLFNPEKLHNKKQSPLISFNFILLPFWKWINGDEKNDQSLDFKGELSALKTLKFADMGIFLPLELFSKEKHYRSFLKIVLFQIFSVIKPPKLYLLTERKNYNSTINSALDVKSLMHIDETFKIIH